MSRCSSAYSSNTTTDAETGIATIGGGGVSVTVEAPSEYFQHSDRAVFGIIIATFLLTMGIVVFIVLGGGKVGLYMTNGIVLYTFIGSADIAMKVTDNQEAEQPLSAPDLHRILAKRGVCWLAIGALYGLSLVLWFNTYEPKRAGEIWQLEAILCAAVSYFVNLILEMMMMFQIHRDKAPNVWRFLCFYTGLQLLKDIGDCSPYPLLSVVGTVLYLLGTTVGLYVVVMHLDCKAEPSAEKNGYVALCAAGPMHLVYKL